MSTEKELKQFENGVKSVMRTTADGRTYHNLTSAIEGDAKRFNIFVFDAKRGELERKRYHYDKNGRRRLSRGKNNGVIRYFDRNLKTDPEGFMRRVEFFSMLENMMDYHFACAESVAAGDFKPD